MIIISSTIKMKTPRITNNGPIKTTPLVIKKITDTKAATRPASINASGNVNTITKNFKKKYIIDNPTFDLFILFPFVLIYIFIFLLYFINIISKNPYN